MQLMDILKKWAIFSDYDNERTSFGYSSYWIHEGNKKVQTLLNYDETGVLSVLYAKQLCLDMLKKFKPKSYFELIENPSTMEDVREMWNDFNHTAVLLAEESMHHKINEMVDKVSVGKLVGHQKSTVPTERIVAFIIDAVDGLQKCIYDVYSKGKCSESPFGFNTSIHIFETAEACLRALNNSQDGIYLCYIRLDNTAYGYFGFFVKDGENMFSLSERINEKYPGQHSNKRNHSDTDKKQYQLFPYERMFTFSEHDYKGYASQHIIDESNLVIFDLGADAYIPLLIAMYLINKQYIGREHQANTSYVYGLALCDKKDELLSDSNPGLAIIKDNTPLATTYKSPIFKPYDKDTFLKGDYSHRFNSKEPGDTYLDYGIFDNKKQYFVELYGMDFDDRYLDAEAYRNEQLQIGVSNEESLSFYESMKSYEFVGSKKRVSMMHYWWARKALAQHIVRNMKHELVSFGGRVGVFNWYKAAIEQNAEHLWTIFAKYAGQDQEIIKAYGSMIKKQSGSYPLGMSSKSIFNKKDATSQTYLCPVNGTASTIFFVLSPMNWRDLMLILNQCSDSLPKIVKGWSYYRECTGNSILDIIDPVSLISHPLGQSDDFKVAIGFSKRGFAKMCKDKDITLPKDWAKTTA